MPILYKVKEVKEKYQIPVYACMQEEVMLAEPTINMTAVDPHRFSLHKRYFLKNFFCIVSRVYDQQFSGLFIFQKIAVGKHGRLCRKSFSESISYAGKTGGDPSDTWSF